MSRYPLFHSIIVPVDGSDLAESAIPYALAIAARAKSKVRFALVHPDRYPPLLIEPPSLYLTRLAERYREQLGDSVSTIILTGSTAPELAQHARDIGADLVVMATHGWGGIRRAWLGSVAEELIRTLDVPVIVVRPVGDGQPPRLDFREILVPLDGSALAESALKVAGGMAQLWDAELSLVQMVYPVNLVSDPALPIPGGYDPELTALQRESAETYVRSVAERLRERGLKASGIALVSDQPPVQSLIELADPERVSLVALATHGRGGISRALLGSVAAGLVRGAGVPVLVTHPARSSRPAAAPVAGQEPAHV